MIAQTFFLLSVSSKLNDHLAIHFGRPNMKKCLESISPGEVYYCGGEGFKESVRALCSERRLPFHSESFDAADSSLLNRLATSVESLRPKQSFATQTNQGKRYDSVSTGYSYSKKHSSIFN
jgi:ferredoxin-NADP reductase